MGLPVPVAVSPPGLEVALYDVTAEPPLLVGAAKLMDAVPAPPTADTLPGAPGADGGDETVNPNFVGAGVPHGDV